ncbi:MAG: hypothetical protein H8E15_06495 [Planctomycetes bacterium]|nr:hypothetical protein [Planctomycetota bacterium]
MKILTSYWDLRVPTQFPHPSSELNYAHARVSAQPEAGYSAFKSGLFAVSIRGAKLKTETPEPHDDTRNGSEDRVAKWIFLASGINALACISPTFIAESLNFPEVYVGLTQLMAAIVCFMSSRSYLKSTRRTPSSDEYRKPLLSTLAVIGATLSGLWIGFWVLLLVALSTCVGSD